MSHDPISYPRFEVVEVSGVCNACLKPPVAAIDVQYGETSGFMIRYCQQCGGLARAEITALYAIENYQYGRGSGNTPPKPSANLFKYEPEPPQ